MERELVCTEAIREATLQCMEEDDSVYLMGLGVPDPKAIFGTTQGLQELFGSKRVMDMPLSENAMTGVAIGSAIAGKRPILIHQRMDFTLLALDQVINNAAKWHYMFDGIMKAPLVIRMMVGRGWGQGPQHSQSLQALYAQIPGLKVVMPSTPYNSKGLLVAAIEDDNPVIFIEHRWIHGVKGHVPSEKYKIPLGKARTVYEGKDLTIISSSYMSLEAQRAVEYLQNQGLSIELIDLQSIRPLDTETMIHSVNKTVKVLVVDGAWKSFGVSAEIIALLTEECWDSLKSPPKRLCFPEYPTPTSWILAQDYYPRAHNIVSAVCEMMEIPEMNIEELERSSVATLDAPDCNFTGPF